MRVVVILGENPGVIQKEDLKFSQQRLFDVLKRSLELIFLDYFQYRQNREEITLYNKNLRCYVSCECAFKVTMFSKIFNYH